jgi:hypothetical protein
MTQRVRHRHGMALELGTWPTYVVRVLLVPEGGVCVIAPMNKDAEFGIFIT